MKLEIGPAVALAVAAVVLVIGAALAPSWDTDEAKAPVGSGAGPPPAKAPAWTKVNLPHAYQMNGPGTPDEWPRCEIAKTIDRRGRAAGDTNIQMFDFGQYNDIDKKFRVDSTLFFDGIEKRVLSVTFAKTTGGKYPLHDIRKAAFEMHIPSRSFLVLPPEGAIGPTIRVHMPVDGSDLLRLEWVSP